MIVVCVTQSQISVDGHAGYSGKGKDIICAAVSLLTQNLIGAITAFTSDSIEYQIEPGHIDIDYENLSERGRLLVDSFFIGICSVANTYGQEYVKVI